MQNLFHIIEDAQVILRSRGTFYQKKVYRRDNRIYAAWGTGFIRLGGGDATSNSHVSYEGLNLPFQPAYGSVREPLIPAPTPLKAAA